MPQTESLINSEGFCFALESSPTGMLLVDSDGKIRYANRRAQEIFRDPDLDQRYVEELIPMQARMRHMQHRDGYMRAPERREMGEGRHLRALRRDETTFPVEVALNPTEWRGARYVVCSVVDISARVQQAQTEQRLLAQAMEEQRVHSLGLLAGGIAHDFNNLLVGVMGNASLVDSLLDPASPAKECVADIQAAAKQASELARQMLAYSGRGALVMQPLNLSASVAQMSGLLRSWVPETVELVTALSDGLPQVMGDPNQVKQVVMNLITNAVEAITHDRGQVRLSTGAVYVDEAYLSQLTLAGELTLGQHVYFQVADNGCGMDSQTLASMFDPFFTTKPGGHGLGLAATQGVLRSHKAGLQVYSELGQGSTIKLLFPALKGTGTLPDEPSESPRCVLVIDDDAMVQRLTKRVLNWNQFQVVQAMNGEEGLRLFREQRSEIDAVLLDMTMPVMSGPETFRGLRELDPGLPIVVSSGFSEDEAVSVLPEEQDFRFVQKPYTSKQLVQVLEEAIQVAWGPDPA